jgi:hypothetical protein
MPGWITILVFVAEHFGVPALVHFLESKFPELGKEFEDTMPGLVKLIVDIVSHRQTAGPSAPLPEHLERQIEDHSTIFSPAAIRLPELV